MLCGMVEVTGQGKTMRVQADAINIISCKSETEPNQWTASLSVEVRGPCAARPLREGLTTTTSPRTAQLHNEDG